MYISQKRIVNIDNFLVGFKKNEKLRIIVNNPENHKERLKEIGFSSLDVGNVVLPKAVGSVSKYNKEGKYKLLRDLPKEDYSIDRDHTFLAFGKHLTTKTITFTYHRYQRELISLYEQEIYILNDKDEKPIISSETIVYSPGNKDLIKHTVNLFLEIFGECQLVDENLLSRVITPMKKLSWNLLPKGELPWDQLEKYLNKNTDLPKSRNIKEIYARINYINSFKPNFLATGNGGFNDYIVLGFEEQNLYILENRKPQNATYIFEKDWKEITKLTKADILREGLCKYRLLHTNTWKERIKDILTF